MSLRNGQIYLDIISGYMIYGRDYPMFRTRLDVMYFLLGLPYEERQRYDGLVVIGIKNSIMSDEPNERIYVMSENDGVIFQKVGSTITI